MRFRWRTGPIFAASLAISLLLFISRHDVAHAQVVQDYHHAGWASESGIGAVFDIEQSTDGYLWLTTSKGVFRFDGVRVQSISEVTGGAAQNNEINSFYLSRSGGVWLSTRSAGLLYWNDAELTIYKDRRCTPALNQDGLAEDRDGSLWVHASGGLFRMHGSTCEPIGTEHGYPNGFVATMLMDHRGTFWVETDSGDLLYLLGGQSRFSHSRYRPGPSVGQVYLREAPDGAIWLSDDYGLRRITDSEGASLTSASTPSARKPSISKFGDFTFEPDGSLWAATSDGVKHFDHVERWSTPQAREDAPGESFTSTEGLSSNAVQKLFVDREGSIWVGTNSGLDQFRRTALTTFIFPNSHEDQYSVAPGDHGTVWIGNKGLQLSQLSADGKLTTYPGTVWPICIRKDHNGTIWAAGKGRSHLLRIDGTKFTAVHYPGEELALVVSDAADRNNELWTRELDLRSFTLVEAIGQTKTRL